MFPFPFALNEYGMNILSEQISVKLLVFAHIPTAIIAIIFAGLLYVKTKKLSGLYLLLLCVSYGIWSYLSLVTWSGTATMIMFSWSLLGLFEVCFLFLSYWFFYVFVRNEDLPVWQKIGTASLIIPSCVIALRTLDLGLYDTAYAVARENLDIYAYYTGLEFLFAIFVAALAVKEYRKVTMPEEKRKISLAATGTILFLLIFQITGLITNMIIRYDLWGYGDYAYNVEVYGLFGMPVLVIFLGYLIAKYQAFDLKVLRSVSLVIVLMLLLFVTIFI